jgi:tetratricopeptide (TPR) repeat protein
MHVDRRSTADSSALDPASPAYREARSQIARHAWGKAQRALESAVDSDTDARIALDLRSVRVVRRALRRIARWPSDVEAHLDLGRAYFELELGDEALAEFTCAQRLAPGRFEPFVLASLEYLYRGAYTDAMLAWTAAAALKPELGPFDTVLGSVPSR